MKKLIIVLFIISIESIAQANHKQDSLELANFFKENIESSKPDLKPQLSDSVIKKAYIKYQVFAFEHRIKVYSWQLLSSKIIFAISIIIVLLGLYLSYKQFEMSISYLNRQKTENKKGSKKEEQKEIIIKEDESEEKIIQNNRTTLEISKDGIKIDSAVIGLLIMIISVAFFFLYLKFVFGING